MSTDPRALLSQLEARAKKRFGQHFLARPDLVERIVRFADVGPGDRVVEIGPGLGVLTEALLATGAEVTAVEIDRDLTGFLRDRFGDRLRLVAEDATRVDWAQLCPGSGWKLVANLPYNVGTPLVMEMARLPGTFATFTCMLQAEVVARMVAGVDDDAYGAMSVLLQARGTVRTLFGVPPSAFFPPPKVDSAVFQVVLRDVPEHGPGGEVCFQQVVRGAFAQRRKTLRNALGAALGRDTADTILAQAGIPPTQRAERVDAEGYRALAGALWRCRQQPIAAVVGASVDGAATPSKEVG